MCFLLFTFYFFFWFIQWLILVIHEYIVHCASICDLCKFFYYQVLVLFHYDLIKELTSVLLCVGRFVLCCISSRLHWLLIRMCILYLFDRIFCRCLLPPLDLWCSLTDIISVRENRTKRSKQTMTPALDVYCSSSVAPRVCIPIIVIPCFQAPSISQF